MYFSSSSSDDEGPSLEYSFNYKDPHEPTGDLTKRPVRRMNLMKRKGEEETFSPNVDNVIAKLKLFDGARPGKIDVDPFSEELKAVEARTAKVQRGVPLARVVKTERSRRYPMQQVHFTYGTACDALEALPTVPPQNQIKNIEFIMPLSEEKKKHMPMGARISTCETAANRLRKIVSKSIEYDVKMHNNMVNYLNHSNERRLRAMRQFYKDMQDYGYDEAEKRSYRAARRSRLRIMSKYSWWDDFIEFAFQKRVTQNEEKLIERIATIPNLNDNFINLMKEVSTSRYNNRRCLELLNWINNRCKIVDDDAVAVIKETAIPHTARVTRRMTTRKSTLFIT